MFFKMKLNKINHKIQHKENVGVC